MPLKNVCQPQFASKHYLYSASAIIPYSLSRGMAMLFFQVSQFLNPLSPNVSNLLLSPVDCNLYISLSSVRSTLNPLPPLVQTTLISCLNYLKGFIVIPLLPVLLPYNLFFHSELRKMSIHVNPFMSSPCSKSSLAFHFPQTGY